MIRFDHVTRRYEPGGNPALDDVTVEFHRGEFAFLIGASGSGKSTLLRMILREGLPQQGRITVAGQNLGLMLERRVPAYRRSIGMVFQDFRLLPDKTVYDNVAFAMRVIGARRSQIRRRVTRVLERVDLEHLAKRYPHEISGGEQQRAAIARAIVNEPAILMADEPTGNLDPRASDEVIRILRWINTSGATVIMATHDRAIVDSMRRRVVQLHRGRLVRDDERGTYDPPRDSQAWKILLTDEEESGAWSAADPRAATAAEQHETDTESEPVDAAPQKAAEPAEEHEPNKAAGADRTGAAGSSELKPSAEDADPAPSAGAGEAPDTSGIRIVWPQASAESDEPSLPEPAGDFSGAEIPDLAHDGYAETAADEAEGPTLSWLAHAEDAPVDHPAVTAEAPPEGQSGTAPGPHQAAPDSEASGPGPVPRPKSSASQASYTDTRRTAEQLGVRSGGFLRRFRRDG